MNFKVVINELLEAGYWTVLVEAENFANEFKFEVYEVDWYSDGGIKITGAGDCTEINITEPDAIYYDDDFDSYTFEYENIKITISAN